jgi:hypothetical protein
MSDTRFVVERRNWRRAGSGWVQLPGRIALQSFGTADEAEAERRDREAETRRRVGNPFRCGPALPYLTSFPEPVFLDWLLDAGLVSPEPDAASGRRDWAAWWEAGCGRWSDVRRARVWDGLDKVRFFDVTERPAARTAYAVVRVLWEYNDQWMEPGDEGGDCVRAFRRRADAEAYRDLLEEQARRERDRDTDPDEEPSHYGGFEIDRWRRGPFDEGHESRRSEVVGSREATFYEVVEIEADEPPAEGGR